MSNQILPHANCSSGFPLKQVANNAILNSVRPMPSKFGYAMGGSMFAMARSVFTKDAGGGQNYNDSSAYIALKRNNAIGKSSTKTGLAANADLGFKSDQGNRVSLKTVWKVRAGGCVAPAKKGANTAFKSGGNCC